MHRKTAVIEESVEQRRREKRIACDPVQVRITAEGDRATVEGQVLDVSRCGLKFRAGKQFPRGKKVAVEMNGLLVRGKICYCRAHNGCFDVGFKVDAGSFDMGMQIEDTE